jgi:acyl carrier protein
MTPDRVSSTSQGFDAAAAPALAPQDESRCERIITLLSESVGADRRWLADLGPGTRLDADLALDSLELAGFAAALAEHYGSDVDLLAFIAGLDIDEIIGLTIADVARHVGRRGADADAAAGARGGQA